MYALKAIYDGNNIQFDEPIPVKGKYEVVIAFTKPIERTQEKILEYFNTWDEDDVNCITEIMKERGSLFQAPLNRFCHLHKISDRLIDSANSARK